MSDREHDEMKRRQWVHGLPAKHREYVLGLEAAEAALEHCRTQAGPDSCADLLVRATEAEARVAELEGLLRDAASDGCLEIGGSQTHSACEPSGYPLEDWCLNCRIRAALTPGEDGT